MVGFIGEKFWWNTKIPIFWRFCPQNVTLYRPTQVMNHKKIIIFFTFTLVPYILCCLKVIFWWFGMSHWWKILMKYQNTHILTIMAPKCDPLSPYPGHESRKYHYFFHFAVVPYILCCWKIIFWWFGMFYWGEILIKHQNTYILKILAPKWYPLPP